MHLTFSVNAAIKKGKGLDLGVEPQTLLSLDTSLPTYIERPPWPPPAKKVVKGRSSKGSKPVRFFPLKGSHGRSAV